METFHIERGAFTYHATPDDQYYRVMDWSVKGPNEADLFNCEGILQGTVSLLREKY